MDVAEFDYELPPELIAQAPAADRAESRLLVLDRATGAIVHARFAELPAHLAPGDLLVVNNTRVFAARLLGERVPSGGRVECLLIARVDQDRPSTGSGRPALGEGRWDALMHPGQKLRPGARVKFEAGGRRLYGEILERRFYGRRTIRLWTDDPAGVDSVIDAIGHVPLPPYIKRPDRAEDRERYQTIFARVRGSVAAPTAGLHFTPALIDALAARGVAHMEITLHVGYGTFKPVRAERVEDHTVDPEWFEIGADAAAAIAAGRRAGGRLVAVGTTTARALETAVRRGAGQITAGSGMTELYIYPGFSFQAVDALITNFHLPRSSLLLLVCAVAGRELVLRAYREAIERRYRFYSYGDGMLIL